MISQTLWFEHKFNFDFPAGMYPVILERLRGTSARIRMLTIEMNEEDASRKLNSKWSVKEHIGHLHDLEELHEARIDDFIEGKKMLRAWDTTNRKTEEANHNSKLVSELIGRFEQSRTKFI